MIELEKGKYTITKLTPEITWLYDGINDSIYVDEAEDAAFVIDTGMADGSLTEVLRTVTDKPLTVAVTHGHLDHVMKAGEFESFYMSMLDDALIPEKANIDLARRIDIHDGDVIEIPGMDLVCVALPGHTAGSMLFVNRRHRIVYDGDAMCNGRNLWLQIPGGIPLSEYGKAVEKAMNALKALGVDDTWEFLGGHYEQRYDCRFEKKEDNPPCLGMMEDLIVLCEMLVSGEITGEIETQDPSMKEQAYNAHYGRAEILYTLSKLK